MQGFRVVRWLLHVHKHAVVHCADIHCLRTHAHTTWITLARICTATTATRLEVVIVSNALRGYTRINRAVVRHHAAIQCFKGTAGLQRQLGPVMPAAWTRWR